MAARRLSLFAIFTTMQVLLAPSLALCAVPSWTVGRYTGFDPILSQYGLSLEESALGFWITSTSVTVSSVRDYEGRLWNFSYKGDWIVDSSPFVTSLNDFFRHCYGLRATLNSDRLHSILCVNRLKMGPYPHATLLSGKNPSVKIGVFYKDGSNNQINKIRQRFEEERTAPLIKMDRHWEPYLYPQMSLDHAHAKKAMRSSDSSAKIATLKSLENNLWSQNLQDLESSIEIIKMGLNDSDLRVQVIALQVFMLDGGQVTQAFPLVVDLLGRAETLDEILLSKAIDTAALLLARAKVVIASRTKIQNAFGISDLAELHLKTGGLLDANYREAIEALLFTQPFSGSWTMSHFMKLSKSVIAVADNERLPQAVRDSATKVMRDQWPASEGKFTCRDNLK